MSDAFDDGSSGTWRGFYVYAPGSRRHAMRLELAFVAGSVTGGGTDDIGRFTIRGTYDPDGVRVSWHKHYLGAHSVWYDGVRDGDRSRVVYGGWSIANVASGGFRIWRGSEAADAESLDVAVTEFAEQYAGARVR